MIDHQNKGYLAWLHNAPCRNWRDAIKQNYRKMTRKNRIAAKKEIMQVIERCCDSHSQQMRVEIAESYDDCFGIVDNSVIGRLDTLQLLHENSIYMLTYELYCCTL